MNFYYVRMKCYSVYYLVDLVYPTSLEKSHHIFFFFLGGGGGRIKNEKMQGLKGFATSSAALNYVRQKYEILTYSVLHTVWGLYGAGMDGIQGPLFSTFCCFLLGILLAKQKVCILLLASYFLENFFFFFFISRVSVSEL